MMRDSFISYHAARRALTKTPEHISLQMITDEISKAGQATGVLGYQKLAHPTV